RGEPVAVQLRRSVVRSRAKLNYVTAQGKSDVGSLHPAIELLPRVGRLRLQAARRRHAIDLDIPDAEYVADGEHGWTLRRRASVPLEQYNAQISLLTGMCAADMMVQAGYGILRTVPEPHRQQLSELRHSAQVLGLEWPDDQPVGDMVSALDS